MAPVAALQEWETVSVRGPDRISWLNGLISCDVSSLEAGSARSGFLLTKQGKVRATLIVIAQADLLYLAIAGATAQEIHSELDHHLVMEDVELEMPPPISWVLTTDGLELPGAISARFLELGAGGRILGALSPPEAVKAQLRDASADLSSQAFLEARLRAGYPLMGVDYSGKDNPHEAGLEKAYVSFSKGCYLGQEVVCMQEMRGKVKRRLVRLSVEGSAIPDSVSAGVPLTAAGEEVGSVTSVNSPWILASIRAPHYEPGALLAGPGASFRVDAVQLGLGAGGSP